MSHRDITIIFRPIEKWPRMLLKHGDRRSGAGFKTGYDQTMRELREELGRIGVSEAVIEVAVGESDIRLDGQLRGDRKPPAHPGVVLSFDRPGVGPLKFPCDTYAEMRDNIRAIRLSLEALRAVDRYGVTQSGEQYRGWAQLPPPGGSAGPAPELTPRQAAEQLVKLTGDETMIKNLDASVKLILGVKSLYQQVYRDTVKHHHADANAGVASESWYQLQAAKDVLDKHHNL